MALTRRTLILAILLATLARAYARAQETAPTLESASAADPAQSDQIVPGKLMRTARLFRFTGDVQVQRTDNTGEDTAVLNMPLPEGTRISTGDYAQAEIEFDDGSIARLTPRSTLTIDLLGMDEKAGAQSELTLLSGLAYFELRHVREADWIVQAGAVVAEPTSNTVVRIALDQPPATFAVMSGSMKLASMATDPDTKETGFTANVRGGESLKADPDDATRYFLNRQVEPESWDSWNQSRDDHAADASATRTSARDAYAANQAYGWSDLDANGTWYAAPAAGDSAQDDGASDGAGDLVWQPAAAADPDAGFDPYGDGAFVWSGGAYVWASAYPWGWTPYRCGRWEFYAGLGWVWRPSRFCLTFGYGGYTGVFIGHRRPPRYRPIALPIPKPGPVHPILRVKSPQPHPVKPHVASPGMKVAHLDGREVHSLEPLGPVGGGGAMGGQALYRDFPVDARTHTPVVGISEKTSPSTPDPEVGGWISRQSQAEPANENAPARVVRTPAGATVLRPVPVAPRPAPAPVAQHTEHASAPAPAPRSEPAPASPAKPK